MALTEKQIEVIEHESGNILISASAGSGKTHTMIERIKRLMITEGVDVKNILALTFTEASANDMKNKLVSALLAVINDDKDKYTKEEKDICKKQLSEIPTADISTIHSFCARIIRSYFFEVGLSPDFAVADKTVSDVLKIKSVEKTFKEFYDAKPVEEWFLKLVDRYASGRLDRSLKSLILDAHKYCVAEAEPLALAKKYTEVYSKEGIDKLIEKHKQQFDRRVKGLINDCFPALQFFKEEGLSKCYDFTQTLITDMENAISQKDLYCLNKFKGYKLPLKVETKISETAKEYKKVASGIRDTFIATISTFTNNIGENLKQDIKVFESLKENTENFVKVLERFIEIYAKEKREENVLDFNDLEHFALEILENEQIREAIKENYSYIFIDEYQDTNGVQEQIVSKIAKNNVFMVGDVKQSIYGFRGCRPDFFIEKDKKMSENGEKVVRLNHNFRSAKKVINTVNTIFDYCMTEDFYGESYRDKARLIPGDGLYPEEAEGRAELHYLVKQETEKKLPEESRLYDVIKEQPKEETSEIQAISALIANIVMEECGKTFYDAKKEKFRPIGFGDIAVLSRVRNGKYINEIVSGLIKNNIPVSSDVAENVCDYPEIKILINALKLVDCFLQDLPLASTLKSIIGGFTEEELFEIAKYYQDNAKNPYGGFSDAFKFYVENAKTELCQKLKAFEEYIDKVRLSADFVGAHGVLLSLMQNSNYEAHLYSKPMGEKMVNRVKKFLSSTKMNGKTLTVREFLLRVETCPEAFGLSPFAEENTITVTTIHSSKGLEYPVVIICGLERGFNCDDDSKEIMESKEYGFATMFYDDTTRERKDTVLRSVIREDNKINRIKEQMRLFYVATTRATYSLHMCFWSKEDTRKKEFTGANKFLDFVPPIINATIHDNEYLESKRKLEEIKDVIIVKPDEQMVETMKKNYAFSYPFEEDCSLSLKASVTEVVKNNFEDETPLVHVLFDEESPDIEKGVIAHKILEHFDFNTKIPLKEHVENLMKNGILSESEAGLINLERLSKAISHSVFNDLKGKELYREKTFLMNIPAKEIFPASSQTPVLLQGVIDLLVIDKDTARVIDYKYSSLSSESLKQKYQKQLDLYAYAVEKVLNKKVSAKVLVNIFTGEAVEV